MRIYRLTVSARNPDEARAKARIRDPLYLSSVDVKLVGEVREVRVNA